MSLAISRRGLLLTTAGGMLAGLVAPASLGDVGASARPTMLIAGRRTLEVNGRAATVFGITQTDGTRGLYTEVGKPFLVTLRNDIGEDTLVHWHGLMPPFRQDGVPGISGPPVAAGRSADYNFPLNFAGTFWMHAHQGLQEQSLMSAPLIIRERGTQDRQEVVLMLHDFSFKSPEEIFASLRHATSSMSGGGMSRMMGMGGSQMAVMPKMPGMSLGQTSGHSADAGAAGMALDLNDVVYDAFLANDRTLADPEVVRVEAGGRVLLRVINASAASNFQIDLGQVRATLLAVDGHPVQPLTGSVFPVAIAQRLELEFQLTRDQNVVPVLAGLEGERKRTGMILATATGKVPKFSEQASTSIPPLNLVMEQTLRAAQPLTVKAADRVHQVDLTGSMGTYVWGLNGLTYGHDKPLMVAKGQRVELLMINRTMMSHPMHLHGHVFQVVALNGRRFSGAVRDTVLVPPMQSVTVAFDANNPGRWAFHCHNLYHMRAGMMTTVQYENF